MNRIDNVLKSKNNILSIYFTAGYPNLNDTEKTIINLQQAGVDMIEIGLPFSDPLADGPTIQESGTIALENGMTTEVLFNQLKNIREKVTIPLLIMGYLNPILQFGIENFCAQCKNIGIDGLIIPDLPVDIYEKQYKSTFEKFDLYNIFLITPQTSENRIKHIDAISKGFIYMVSSNSTTGATTAISEQSENYFKRMAAYKLKNPQIVGFGIHDKLSFLKATQHQKGAIIGTDFIKYITANGINDLKGYFKKYDR